METNMTERKARRIEYYRAQIADCKAKLALNPNDGFWKGYSAVMIEGCEKRIAELLARK